MAGFSSVADLYSETVTNGKRQIASFRRIGDWASAALAGRHCAYFTAGGHGGVGSWSGSAGVGVAKSSASAGALPLPQVSGNGDTLRLLRWALTNIRGVTDCSGTYSLIDILYIYPACVVTGTPTTIDNTASKPTRFNNGIGVQLAAVAETALGAAAPQLSFGYTNSSSVGSRSGRMASAQNSLPAGMFFHGSEISANFGGMAAWLAAGDSGVKQLDSYSIDANSTTGTITFILYRPIAILNVVQSGASGVQAFDKDFVGQFPSMPVIDNSACLSLVLRSASASSITGAQATVLCDLEIGWG